MCSQWDKIPSIVDFVSLLMKSKIQLWWSAGIVEAIITLSSSSFCGVHPSTCPHPHSCQLFTSLTTLAVGSAVSASPTEKIILEDSYHPVLGFYHLISNAPGMRTRFKPTASVKERDVFQQHSASLSVWGMEKTIGASTVFTRLQSSPYS